MTGFMCLKIEKEKTPAKCIYAASKQSLFMGRMQKQKLSKKQGDVIQLNLITEAHVYDKKTSDEYHQAEESGRKLFGIDLYLRG